MSETKLYLIQFTEKQYHLHRATVRASNKKEAMELYNAGEVVEQWTTPGDYSEETKPKVTVYDNE